MKAKKKKKKHKKKIPTFVTYLCWKLFYIK